MANIKNIEQKSAKVSEVKEKLEKAKSFVVFNYSGLTVEQATDLRTQMRNAGVEYVVLKNGIVRRACEAAKVDEAIEPMLHGPSAFAFGYDDAVTPAKILNDFAEKAKIGYLKGGIVEGEIMDQDRIKAVASLPTRDVLIARMLGSMLSPIQGFVIALDQIAKQKQGE